MFQKITTVEQLHGPMRWGGRVKGHNVKTGELREDDLQSLQQKFSNILIFTCLFSKKYSQVHYSFYKFTYCVLLYTGAKVLGTF